MMNLESRGKLLARARQGSAESMGELLEHYRPFLRILARRHLDTALNSRVDPSDLVQQTCLEAHRDLPVFRGEHEREFVAWLRRILENSARDSIQRHITTQKRSIRSEERMDVSRDGRDAVPIPCIAAKQSSPSSRAMRGELAIRLATEVEGLPDDQREAIRLRHFEGVSLEELAAHFDRSSSAVAGLLKRGLRTLRTRLADLS